MTPADQHALRDALARAGQSGKFMPIMLSDEMKLRVRRGERFVHVRNVPWELFGDPCEQISQQNHGQSLARIAERGGFDAPEAVCILTGVHWRDGRVSEDQAHRILYAMTAFYRRGALAAEAENTRLKDERDAARDLAGLTWTVPDVDAWGKFADERGATGIRDRLNRLFRRAVTAEEQVRQLLNDADRKAQEAAEEPVARSVLATIPPKENPGGGAP